MLSKHFVYNTFLVIGIGILGYVSMDLYKENNREEVRESPHPLFVIKEYEMTRFSDKGDKTYTISGSEMHHFDDARGTSFTSPFITHFTLENIQRDWTAESDNALMNEDQSLITMNDNVVLIKYDQNAVKTTVLTTSQLLIHDRGEKVTNDVWTKIQTYPNNTIEGIGLVGFPKIGQFNLLKDVKSYYETIKQND